MSEEEKESSKEPKTREEKMKEMKEKVKEMYGNKGEGQSSPGPRGMGQASLMNRMASMQGGQKGGRETKALIRAINELRTETKEMKRYLKEILEILKEEE